MYCGGLELNLVARIILARLNVVKIKTCHRLIHVEVCTVPSQPLRARVLLQPLEHSLVPPRQAERRLTITILPVLAKKKKGILQ